MAHELVWSCLKCGAQTILAERDTEVAAEQAMKKIQDAGYVDGTGGRVWMVLEHDCPDPGVKGSQVFAGIQPKV